MGAWDVTAFGNDEAADLVLDLLEQSNPRDFLARILAHSKETEYLEAPEGSQMVAAAAIIGAAKNQGAVAVPENLAAWVKTNGDTLKPFLPVALDAIARVRGNESELRELWQESDELDAWNAELDAISAALR